MAGSAAPDPAVPGRRTEHGTHLADLVEVMDRLRSPGGCPWDAEQTHESLLPYAVEEVFEVVDAVEQGDRAGLREELGDLLLQVVFHARVAQEHPSDPFDLDDVAAGIAAKLRHRHPHVFAGDQVTDAQDVHRRWEQIKAAEKGRASVLDGVPLAMPALARAQKVLGRVERAGLPLQPFVAAATSGAPDSAGDPGPGVPNGGPLTAEQVGAAALALAARAAAAGIDAEAALRAAVRRLEDGVRSAEAGPPPG